MKEIKIEVLDEVSLSEEEIADLEEFQVNLANGGAGGGIICFCKT